MWISLLFLSPIIFCFSSMLICYISIPILEKIGKKKVKKKITKFIESNGYKVNKKSIDYVFSCNESIDKKIENYGEKYDGADNFFWIEMLFDYIRYYCFNNYNVMPGYYDYYLDIKNNWNEYFKKLRNNLIIKPNAYQEELDELKEDIELLMKKYDYLDVINKNDLPENKIIASINYVDTTMYIKQKNKVKIKLK